MENWYLACHKAGRHNAFKAQMFLAQMNAAVFIPQIYCRYPRSDRPGQLRKVLEPLFPGYMFIYFDPELLHTSKVSCCPGVSHLVRFADVINPVNDIIVEEIMQLPICVQDTDSRVRRGQSKNNAEKSESSIPLNDGQRQLITKISEENDGSVRSALLYAFSEATLSKF
ncbi:transcription termination/antitermination NusG family protein [Serratia proteamaculans]